jgi:carbonic anhydrase
MLSVLLTASLTCLSLVSDQHHGAEAKHEEAAKPKSKAEDKAKAEDSKHKAEEAPAKADEAKGKARHKPASPAVPEPEEKPKAEPAHGAAPKRAARPVAPKPRVAAMPAEAQFISEAEVRAARLQAENAVLRQQLYQSQHPAPKAISTPEGALAELIEGNRRFVDGTRVRTLMSILDPELRTTLAKGQAPFAVVICCSDSRLSDTMIFDQELGRLFTVREAGNSPDVQSLASIEYALEHLGSKLVVIMGHTKCGAIQAVSDAHGKPLPGNLWSLQAAMSGLLESTPEDPNEDGATHMYKLTQSNARRQARAVLDRSEIVRELVAQGKVKVVPAVYDISSGKVLFEAAAALAAPAPAAHH